MENGWLTVAELAARLSVSESTIRNWRRAYGSLIPSALGRDGIRRYPLRPFEVVATMRRRNRPTEDIRAALAEDGEPSPEPEGYEARLIGVLTRIATALERAVDLMERREG